MLSSTPEPTAAAVRAFIGIGANQGDVHGALASAFAALAALPDSELRARSSLFGSAPLDAGGPDYLNAAVELRTRLGPEDLLRELQRIEAAHGRERPFRNAPRTLDLDLLLHGDTLLDTPALTLPHPRMHQRAFVLRPLAEIAPGLGIPGRGTVESLLPGVADQRIEPLDRSTRGPR